MRKPFAWTRGRPPPDSRTAPGDPLRQLQVGRGEVDVPGDEERPRADGRSPRRVGCIRAGPKSGLAAAAGAISALRPSYWPRRTSASFTRSGRVAARRRGRRADRTAPRSAAPKARASSTQSSIVVSPSGTNGTTSTAPIRGCSPGLALHVDRRRRATATAASSASPTAVRVAGQRQHAPVVARVARPVEEVDAGRPLDDGRGEPVDDVELADPRNVRDRFDQSPHGPIVTGRTGARRPRRAAATEAGGDVPGPSAAAFPNRC